MEVESQLVWAGTISKIASRGPNLWQVVDPKEWLVRQLHFDQSEKEDIPLCKL